MIGDLNSRVSDLIKLSKINLLDTKLILRYILNLSPAQLIMQHERKLTLEELSGFNECYELCSRGYPLNYIVGYREFYSRQFKVTSDTLIPRPETELLVDEVLKISSRVQCGASVLDLGTGCGAIAISLKLEQPKFKIDAVDQFVQTLDVAKFNAKNLNAEVNFYISNWYTNIKNQYDIIVSNPPYIAADDKHLANLAFEPQAALTDFGDGLGCLRQIVQQAPNYLKLNGWLIVEHGFDQGESVRSFCTNAGLVNIKTIQDYASLDRITLGCKL